MGAVSRIGSSVDLATPNGIGLRFTDADIVNGDDWTPTADGKPDRYGTRPYLLHDHGFTLAVVFARCEQDALDAAVDADKLDRFQVTEADLADYGPEGEGLCYLGNASEPFDIESLSVVELPNPPQSICAAFVAAGYATYRD